MTMKACAGLFFPSLRSFVLPAGGRIGSRTPGVELCFVTGEGV